MFRRNLLPPSSGKNRDFLIMFFFCVSVSFSFLWLGYSRKYFFLSADRHLVTRTRSVVTLRTKSTLVVNNWVVHLHFQSKHFHLFNWWFYGTALCLLGSQWPNCGVSESLKLYTELSLSKPVHRWRRLNHMIYCSYIKFTNNKLYKARIRHGDHGHCRSCLTTRPVRRLNLSAVILQ